MSLLALLASGAANPDPEPPVDPWEGITTTRLHVASFGGSTGAATVLTEARPKGSYRIRHMSMLPARALRLRTTNHIRRADDGDPFTQAMSVELDDGTIIPATYSGQHLTAILGGQTVETDIITLPYPLAAGEAFWVRTYRETAAGGAVPAGRSLYSERGESSNFGSGGADLTLSGPFPAPAGFDIAGGPAMHTLTAETPDTGRSWAITGSSSSEAGSDDPKAPAVLYGSPGFFGRAAMRDGVPALRLARGATSAADLLATDVRRMWFLDGAIFDSITDLIYGMGRNDIASGSAFPQVLADRVITFGSWARTHGLAGELRMLTIQPHTTSTDGWTTVEGQAPQYVDDAGRVKFNAWIRDGMPLTSGAPDEDGTLRAGQPGHPFTGHFDYADAVETSRDSNRWLPGLTADGLHCTPAGYQAVADAMPDLATL